MARKLRDDLEGAVHHVWARGNARGLIYRGDRDRQIYLALLGRVVQRHGWRCLSYCLMPNHAHLIIETPQANLGAGMQRLHGRYAQLFNRRHARVGHVFQGRYGNERIKDDAQMLTAVRYVALNPVTAGLCELPEEWRWSSHAASAAGSAPAWVDIPRLLTYFAVWGRDPAGEYLEAIAGGLAEAAAKGHVKRALRGQTL
jgi:REP element-mobilizing transposase RayT